MAANPSRPLLAGILAIAALATLPLTAAGRDVARARAAGTCSAYSTQAEAQRAADTRDADGDGIYCESLPCPCSTGSDGGARRPTPAPAPKKGSCTRPKAVQRISFPRRKYPNIRAHYIAAVGRGWPRVLVLNRLGADARRDRLLDDYETREGYDRDEYPPAVGRGRGTGLERGSQPRGWKADVEYVGSSENRSHGSRMGAELKRYCNGTKFRYVFR